MKNSPFELMHFPDEIIVPSFWIAQTQNYDLLSTDYSNIADWNALISVQKHYTIKIINFRVS